ncbi:ArsR/SmtB family transcription factor [Poseidonocella sedimentorum]|nr:metalloregulator ArsR/SmtB family transcription factor [Poseidonocella sedimentorum]
MAKYDDTLSACFTALGDPTRRAVLDRLARGPTTVSELAAAHDMALPSFLAHLRKLEAAGLITTAKTGRTRRCALAPGAIAPVRDWLDQQARVWEARLDRFEGHIANLKEEDET